MFLKNKNIVIKIRRSKVTYYAALSFDMILSNKRAIKALIRLQMHRLVCAFVDRKHLKTGFFCDEGQVAIAFTFVTMF